jgi:glycosyltransferase involved in cell wall biosynthesis
MRPSAPWQIIEVELAEGRGGAFAPPLAAPALLIFRFRGAVLGQAHLLPSDLPMTPAEFASFTAHHVATTLFCVLGSRASDCAAWSQAGGGHGADTPVAEDLLGRLDHMLAQRQGGPRTATASIVICTRHRPEALAQCLNSISQEIASGREAIVVDNGPDAATEAAVRTHPGVRYLAEPRLGLSRARNCGLAAASGDVVVFIDDDVRPEPGWIDPLLRHFDEPGVTVACGLVLPESLQTEAEIAIQYELGFGGMGYLPRRFDGGFVQQNRRGVPVWTIGAGANMAIRRAPALDLGGFDERIGPGAAGGCGHESEFWHRALFSGYTAIYEPLSVVRHQHQSDWGAVERQAFGYSFGHVVALFTQYAQDHDPGDLVRAFGIFPLEIARRLLRAPLRRLMGRPDRLLWAWSRGYLAALSQVGLAFRKPPQSDLGLRTRLGEAQSPS